MKEIIAVLLLCVLRLDAIDLQCSLESINWVILPGPGCRALNVNVSSRQTITSVNGQSNFQGLSYNKLHIKDQLVYYIPEGIEKFFPNLEAIAIQSSKLKKIDKKDFENFPKLKGLFLNLNEIEFIPGNLFEANPELVELEFSDNPVTQIGHDLVTHLTKLKEVRFTGNNCINKNYFESQISLFSSDLSKNCSQPADKGAQVNNKEPNAEVQKLNRIIDGLTRQLFILSSQQCVIKPSLALIDFKCEMATDTCDAIDLAIELPGTNIGKVTDSNGNEIQSVSKVQIINQAALFMPTNFAEKFKEVKEITIESSGFFQLDRETFANLSSLTYLTITNNKIREISANAFVDNANMTELHFDGNKLELLDNDSFAGLKNLLELNLAHNLLTHISPAVFANLTSLQTLHLQFNRMKYLVSGVFASLSQLSYLDVSSECYVLLYCDVPSVRSPLHAIFNFRFFSQTISSKVCSSTSSNQSTKFRSSTHPPIT
jgi:Leucine-rich repeat (LRR) protein